ncbi:hypothetical protein CFP65_4967 [Kitasatospora sp. MMS16-BH015]|nr:hypothetical protein CFP65_4967 [Kitasatospora sp. MMS16-BH015]
MSCRDLAVRFFRFAQFPAPLVVNRVHKVCVQLNKVCTVATHLESRTGTGVPSVLTRRTVAKEAGRA